MDDLLTGIIFLSFSVGAIGAALALIGMNSLEKTPFFGAIIGVIGLGVIAAGGLGGVYAMSGSNEIIESIKSVTPQQEAVPSKAATDK